ncbi:MAG: RDD family protein [Pedobacter sp.]|nr:RDD family protein [Pedobacter sp.]
MSAKSRKAKTPAAASKAAAAQTTVESTPPPTPAGIMIRLFAIVYDGLLLVALWMIASAIMVPFGTNESAARAHEIAVASSSFRQFVMFPVLVVITWLFYGYFWTRAGQTLGMQTWRLKVLRFDGHHLRWTDAITRCASACLFPIVCGLISQLAWHSIPGFVISVSLGFLGNYLWMLWSPHGLAWHDQLSGTRVWKLPPEPKKKRKFLGWFEEKNDE